MEGERWDYNENLSPVRVRAARMEDGVTASSSSEVEDEGQEGSEEDEGQGGSEGSEEDEGQEGSEGTDEPGEGSGEGYMSDDDGLGQDSASEYEVEGELGVEAMKKGKRKVDEVEHSNKRRSKANGKEKEKEKVDDDGPTFFDSDYDLSDKEEVEIMAAQVQGWKNVVASMRVIEDGDEVVKRRVLHVCRVHVSLLSTRFIVSHFCKKNITMYKRQERGRTTETMDLLEIVSTTRGWC